MTAQAYRCSKCGLDYEPNEFTREHDLFTWDQDEDAFYVETTCVACTELARIRLADIKKEVARRDPWRMVGYAVVGLFLFFIFVYQWIPGAPFTE